jgi:hypothetical protein
MNEKKAVDDKKSAEDKEAADQIAADQKAAADEAAKQPVVIVGAAGGPFNVGGSGFGGSKGSLVIGGRAVHITRWNDTSIKGTLPLGVKGDVVLTTAEGQVRHGKFPHVPPVIVETTTTTVKTAPAPTTK